ncbi:MAG: SDR family oxidoreductase [Roseiflexaceae bacterium]|jgi:all-trans-retinol dehydrogenase (NAD+)
MTILRGATVLITGGASGIGLMLGEYLLKSGITQLIIWDINAQALASVVQHLSAQGYVVHGYQVDVTDVDAIQQTLARMTQHDLHVDILVNNAGIVVGKPFVEHSHAEITREMLINTNALMHLTREVLPGMLARNRGHIVNIASAAALVANPRMSVYCASKWAVVGWSDSLRLELAQQSSAVQVTTVMPYYIDTGMFAGVKSPIVPILKPASVVAQIAHAIARNRSVLRMPWIVNVLPLLRGLLPSRWFDVIVGEWFGIYHTMETFRGRQ